MAQSDVLRQLREPGSLEEQLLAPDDDGIAGFTTSDFPESRGVFFFGDVHPVMRHAVAKEELDRFQRLLVVLGAVHTHPLEIGGHQQLASALKSAPDTGSQRWLAHQHLTDSIRRDADSFDHGGSLTGTDRAAASEQINVTRELPSSEADYAGGLVGRDIHYANIARDNHVAVEGLAARTKDFLAQGERAACAELRTFLQLGSGENRKSHRVLHQVGMELIWSLVHLLFIYLDGVFIAHLLVYRVLSVTHVGGSRSVQATSKSRPSQRRATVQKSANLSDTRWLSGITMSQ